MVDIEKEINVAKSFLFEDNSAKCQKVWYGTTESIKDYFEKLNWINVKKVLTVCSSGDHIFNLINKGVLMIDTFDINSLTFPYVMLKRALLLSSSYDNYFKNFEKLTIHSKNEQEEYDLFSMIKPFIVPPYDYFWEQLYLENITKNKHNGKGPSLLSKMYIDYHSKKVDQLRNLYLCNEQEYEKTKQNLKYSKITFQCADIFKIPHFFENGYDKIILSNIWNYIENWNQRTFYNYIVNQLTSMLNTNGEILAAYIYNLNDCMITFDTDYDFIKVPSIDLKGNIDYDKNAVLVYRKK